MSKTKTFNPTPDQINAAAELLKAMAWTKTVKPIVEKIQLEELQKGQFKYLEENTDIIEKYGPVCLDLSLTYMIHDAHFMQWHRRVHQRTTAAGLKVESEEFCPLLVAENLERQAKIKLIDSMEIITGVNYDQLSGSAKGTQNIKTYVDLTLKLLTPFVNNDKKIMAEILKAGQLVNFN